MEETNNLYNLADEHDGDESFDEQTEVSTSGASDESAAPDEVVDALVGIVSQQLRASGGSGIVRKAVAVSASDRKKVRMRNVVTDVSNSELVVEAVTQLVLHGDAVAVASDRVAKNRKERLTVSAPEWWWRVATLLAESAGGTVSDVVTTAIGSRLP